MSLFRFKAIIGKTSAMKIHSFRQDMKPRGEDIRREVPQFEFTRNNNEMLENGTSDLAEAMKSVKNKGW